MSEENTSDAGEQDPSKEVEQVNPRIINRTAPPPLWKQVEDQEAEAAAKQKADAESGDDPEGGEEGGSKQDAVAESEGVEGDDTNDAEKDAEGADKGDEDTQSDSVKRRLGQQRDKARKDGKNSEMRASYWEKRAKGGQFTSEEAAAAGQAFEVWPPPTEHPPKYEEVVTQKPAETSEDTDPAPNREDFDDHDEYVDTRGAWAARQEFQRLQKAQGEQEKQRDTDTRNREAATIYSKKLDDARERHSDLDEVFNAVDAGPLMKSPGMSQAIAESEVSADLIYVLAKDPEELHRIASLPFKSQVIAIDSLEKKVLAEIASGEVKPPAVTKEEQKASSSISGAPRPPPKPGSTSSAGGPTKTNDDMLRKKLFDAGIDRPRTIIK